MGKDGNSEIVELPEKITLFRFGIIMKKINDFFQQPTVSFLKSACSVHPQFQMQVLFVCKVHFLFLLNKLAKWLFFLLPSRNPLILPKWPLRIWFTLQNNKKARLPAHARRRISIPKLVCDQELYQELEPH